MTSLMAWVGTDSRRNASIYLASDSRFTIESEKKKWDSGRKLYNSHKYPEILGYCGDALVSSQVLGQIINLIDNDVLFNHDDTAPKKNKKILTFLNDSRKGYFFDSEQEILYGTRYLSEMSSEFYLTQFSYSKGEFQEISIEIPSKESKLLVTLGTGKKSIEKQKKRWEKSDIGGTSRTYYSAFCDALQSGEDPKSGGAPQIVGLYRKGSAKTFGVVHEGKHYIDGHQLTNDLNIKAVKWHNNLFEICDAKTLERDSNAQPQPRPRNV